MKTSSLKLANNSICILSADDRESDLSDDLLSEGTAVQTPLSINSLELNMDNILLSKRKTWGKENSMKNMNIWDIQLDLKFSSPKNLYLSEVQSSELKDSSFKMEKKYQGYKSSDVSPKQSTCQSPTTLKGEIKYLLRWLAQERSNSSEFKHSSFFKRKFDDNKMRKNSIDARQNLKSPIALDISNDISKIRKSSSPMSPEDITMWQILPYSESEFNSIFN